MRAVAGRPGLPVSRSYPWPWKSSSWARSVRTFQRASVGTTAACDLRLAGSVMSVAISQPGHQPGDHRVRGHRPEQPGLSAQHRRIGQAIPAQCQRHRQIRDDLPRIVHRAARLPPGEPVRQTPVQARHPQRLRQEQAAGLGHDPRPTGSHRDLRAAGGILHLKSAFGSVRTGPSTSPILPGQRHFFVQPHGPSHYPDERPRLVGQQQLVISRSGGPCGDDRAPGSGSRPPRSPTRSDRWSWACRRTWSSGPRASWPPASRRARRRGGPGLRVRGRGLRQLHPAAGVPGRPAPGVRAAGAVQLPGHARPRRGAHLRAGGHPAAGRGRR